MKDTMILKDQTVIEIEPGAKLSAVGVLFTSMTEMVTTHNKFTSENLSEVNFKNTEGEVIGVYTDLELVNETSELLSENEVITYFNFREKKSEIERIAALEAEVDTNNETLTWQ